MDAARELKAAIATLVRALVPEATGPRGPIVARVTAIRTAGGQMDALEPRYSVDVQPQLAAGGDDPAMPEIPDVPMPVLWAGPGRGVYCQPAVGALVRIGFEYGDWHRPYIESVTGYGFEAPATTQGAFVIRSGAARIEIGVDGSIDVTGSKVRLCGGGGGLITTESTCIVAGVPHQGGSSKVEAAK